MVVNTVDHAYLYQSGNTYVVHSGRTAQQYVVTVAQGRYVSKVTDCGCRGFYHRGTCNHAQQLEQYLNGKQKEPNVITKTKTQTFPTVQALASFLCSQIETACEDNDTTRKRVKDGCPAWAQELIQASVCEDYRDDEAVFDALAHIADSDDEADSDDIAEGIEADYHTKDLLGWLAADISRAFDVDDALKEFGGDIGLVAAIGTTQVKWREELVRGFYKLLDESILRSCRWRR